MHQKSELCQNIPPSAGFAFIRLSFGGRLALAVVSFYCAHLTNIQRIETPKINLTFAITFLHEWALIQQLFILHRDPTKKKVKDPLSSRGTDMKLLVIFIRYRRFVR